jgi:mannose-1-phosphate guanylyltransferase
MISEEQKLMPVIMAGGSGTRLWPLSRFGHPKQFLPLAGSLTMLQQTVTRLSCVDAKLPVVICNEEHRFLAAEQLREINSLGSIILEPSSKNTAPAIALAALVNQEPDTLMLVLSADHVIKGEQGFAAAIKKAIPLAASGQIVTFGVKPAFAATGYGYIKVGSAIGNGARVDEFIEKPDVKTAESFLSAGCYLWNSGIFLTRVDTYLSELRKYRPDILFACESSVLQLDSDNEFIRPDAKKFDECPYESIDYAIMEKTDVAAVVAMQCEWSDLGTWSSLWEVSAKDERGNACSGDAILFESKNNLVRADYGLVATLGVEDLIITSTRDTFFVASKDRADEVKNLVAHLKHENRSECELHRDVHRPWGKYDSIDRGVGYQVKRLTVSPGEKLSLQMHQYRAEHWVVVAGLARVINGDSEFLLRENESTDIPIGAIHGLENPGKVPLEIIEVQSGSYLGEDDIIRLEDKYGRSTSS